MNEMKLSNSESDTTRAILVTLDDPNRSDGISLNVLGRLVQQNRWKLATLFLVVFLSIALFFFLQEKEYDSSVYVVPSRVGDEFGELGNIGASFGSLAALTGISVGGGGSFKAESFAVLQSDELLREFIVENNLMPELFADKWLADEEKWAVPDSAVPSLADGVFVARKDIFSITKDPATGVIRLRVRTTDPEKSAIWANRFIGLANSKLRERAIMETKRSIEYLNDQLPRTQLVSIQNALYGLLEKQLGKMMAAELEQEYAFRIVDVAVASDPKRPATPRMLLVLAASGIVSVIVCLLFVLPIIFFRSVFPTTR